MEKVSPPTLGQVAVGIVCLGLARYISKRLGRQTTVLKGPSSWNPFGYAIELFKNPNLSGLYKGWIGQYGLVFQVPTVFGRRELVFCDPKAFSHFYVKDTHSYHQTPAVTFAFRYWFGKHLLAVEDDTHKRQRKALTPAFSNVAIKNLTSVFFESADAAKNAWDALITSDEGAIIDVQTWMNHISIDSIGVAGFSHDFGALKGRSSPVVEAFDAFSLGDPGWTLGVLLVISQLTPWIFYMPSKRGDALDKLANHIGEIADDLIAEAKADGESAQKSIIGALVRAETSDKGGGMTREEIRAQMNVLIAAGYESTAISLTWALIQLSKHQDMQAKLREEVLAHEGTPTWEELTHSLPYLDAVMHEILRLHPAGPETLRWAVEDDLVPLSHPIQDASGKSVDHVFVKKGTYLRVPIIAINRLEEFWGKDAEDFKPERWIDNSYTKERASEIQGYHHLLSFIDGPRQCLGKVFAVTEFKAVLFTLIRNFTFEFPDGPATQIDRHKSILDRPKVRGQDAAIVPIRSENHAKDSSPLSLTSLLTSLSPRRWLFTTNDVGNAKSAGKMMSLDDFAVESSMPDTPDELTELADSTPTSSSSSTSSTRCVKDPVHRLITLSNRAWAFVDTKQFQRLRHIKQLGTSYYVWSGASHNRFEHCLGVAHLARLMASHLQKNQPELNITDRDVECVEIAGLCHDLGHGPWSHVWDGMFIPAVDPAANWKHEDGSKLMFDHLIKDNGIRIPEKDETFIRKLIAGLEDDEPCPAGEKRFLFDIVANKRNGLDVDKFDYIVRDSHMVGDPKNVDLPRMLQSARVLDDQICYDIKDANHIYEICAMRFKLHKIVYNHKAAKAIEYMIIDGLIAAEPYMKIVDRIRNPEQFVHLTDNILTTIEETTSEELAPARAILTRIRTRNLYRMVDFKAIDWPHREKVKEYITVDNIVKAAKERHPAYAETLTRDHVIVDFSMMHYGMKEHNPLDFVKFYSKHERNVSRKAVRGDYSIVMPEYHAEVLVRVFTKESEYFGVIQAGYRACLEELKKDIERAEAEALAETQAGATATLWKIKNFLAQMESDPEAEAQPGYQACLTKITSFMERLEAEPIKPLSLDSTVPLGFDDEDMVITPLVPASHPTPPQVDAPSTPKMSDRRSFSRHASASLSFADNSFTTVAPDFAPTSPTRGGRKVKKAKERSQGVEATSIAGPPGGTATAAGVVGEGDASASGLGLSFGSAAGKRMMTREKTRQLAVGDAIGSAGSSSSDAVPTSGNGKRRREEGVEIGGKATGAGKRARPA